MLPEKGRAIKGLVVCNNMDLEPLDLLNGLALACYHPSPKVLILLYNGYKILLLPLGLSVRKTFFSVQSTRVLAALVMRSTSFCKNSSNVLRS